MKNGNIFKIILSAGALALAACGTMSDTMTTSSPPPMNEPEVKPVLHSRTEIWRAGYWMPKEDGGFEWVPGKVIPRPSPTAVWAPAYWAHHTYGWTFVAGHWE